MTRSVARTLSTLLALLLLLLLAGCGRRKEEKAAAPAAKPLTPVSINMNPSLAYGPLMIAREDGFFADEGIDARFVSLDSNSAILAASSGKLDVLSVGVRAGIFNLMLQKVPLAVVADRSHASDDGGCVSEGLVAPPDMAARIEARGGSPRGERVDMTRGGTNEFLISRFLDKHHLTIGDVVAIQVPQASMGGMTHDKVDAIRVVTEPVLSNAVTSGWAKLVASGSSILPGHQISVLVYGKRLLQDDPALGVRFMRAYLRGVRQFGEGKTQHNIAIISRYSKLPPETLRHACWPTLSSDGRIPPAAMQPYLDWALERHYLDGAVPLSTWWNPAFVDAAGRAPA